MKKISTLLVFALFLFLNVQGQVNGDFRSKAGGTGIWNDFNAWETYSSGAWVAATAGHLPTATSATTIQAGQTMAINATGLVCGTLTVNGTLVNDATPVSSLTCGAVTVAAAGKLWLSNSGTTISSNAAGTITGTLQLDAGTFSMGSTTGLSTIAGNLTMTGANATLNITGGLLLSVSSNLSMTNGNINIDPQSLPASTHVLEFQSINGTGVIATGGTITIVNPGTNQNSFPQVFISGSGQASYNFAGSTLRFGDGVSTKPGTAGIGFSLATNSGVLGNVIVNNPAASSNRMVRLYGTTRIGGNLTINAGAGNIFQLDGMYPSQLGFQLYLGGNLVNNGTFNANFTGSNLTLNGTGVQTIGGTGTYSYIRNFAVSNTSTANPSVDEQVNLNVTDGLTLTSGSLGSSNGSAMTIGNSTANATMAITGAGGSMTVATIFAPSGVTFNVTYNTPNPYANITTSNELPAIVNGTLKIYNSNFVTPVSGVTLNKAVSCAILNLAAGVLTTTSTNSITITGTTPASLVGGSSSSYVSGPLTRTIPSGLTGTSNNFKFPVGKTNYHLFEYENITTGGTGNATFTVESFDAGSYSGTAGYGMSTINTDKYWTLNGNPGTVTITSSKIRITDAGLVSTNKIGQSNSVNGTFISDGGILETGTTLASVKALDYSAFSTGTYFRTGLIGAGIAAGNYAIGPNGPYAGYLGTYTTTQLAINDLTDIVPGGNFVFEYQPDYNPSVETFPLTLPQTLSGTSTASITFRPAPGVGSPINFTTAGTVLSISGGSYILFDGRPGGVGTNKYLQFTNTTAAGTTPTVSVSGTSANNQFLYCILKGTNTSTNSGILAFSTTVTGNNGNTISYCNFDGSASASNCLYAASNSSGSGSTITYNNFFDYRNGSGIYVSTGDNALIDNNSMYETAAYNGFAGTTYGINVVSGANCVISNNNIGGSGPGLTGTWTVSATSPAVYNFTGIFAQSMSSASKIFNNKIQNFDWKCNPSTWNGINAYGGVNIGSDGANIIGSNTGNDNIKVTYYANGAGVINGILVGAVSKVENNAIGSITTILASGVTGAGSSIAGINLNYGTGTLVNNNVIGSKTTTNSINAANESTTGNSQNLYGIYSLVSQSSMTGNTIANLYSGITYPTGGLINGISIYDGTASSNMIYSLSTPQPKISTGSQAVIIGINGTNGLILTGNAIYDLNSTAATAAVNVYGIYYSSGSASTNKVDKNYIQSFITASNSAVQNGIYIGSGSGVFQNNVIRLGIDKNGNPITSTAQINGITKASTSACNFYFNTVYIGGSGVAAGTAKSYAFIMTNKATTLEDVRNNIFVNMRTNAVANKLNYAISLPAISTNPWLCDYNIYNTSSTDGMLTSVNGVDNNNLGALQAIYTGEDANSGFGDPLLTSPAAAMSTMNLVPTNLSPAEGNGIAIAGIDDDFIGLVARSAQTPTDIGAYAGNFTPAPTAKDIFFPVITYTPFVKTSIITGRSINNAVTITDNTSGVNVILGTRPRIYYKLSTNANAFVGNSSSNNGWKWVESSTATSPYNFTLDYSILFGGPVTTGNVIQYFIVAQDQATIPNVTFNPGTGAAGTNVGTIATAPTTPNSYTISPLIASAVNVGTGYTYPTLTGTGGLFDAMNNGVINSNIVATIKTNTTEPGTVSLNQVQEEGSNAGTLAFTIQSDGTSHVISGTAVAASAPMISITGANRLTIDGGTGKYLTFRNTNTTASSTGPVVQYNNSSQNDVLTNCYVESNGNSGTPAVGAVTIGTTGTNIVTINSCDIRDARGGTTGSPSTGISSNSATNTVTITNNNIYNFKNTTYSATGYGIYLPSVNVCTITGNSIYMESGMNPISSLAGIYESGANSNNVISGNYVGGQSPNCGGNSFTITGNANGATYNVFNGISIQSTLSTSTGISVQGNTIQNITMNSAGSTFYGINDVGYGPVSVTGNTVGSAITLNSIQIAGTGTSVGIYNNYSNAFYVSVFDNNTVANITLTSATGSPVFNGMKMEGGTVRKNQIFNIGASTAATTPTIYGMYNTTVVQNGTSEFSNNLISLNAGNATNPKLYGFYDTSSQTGTIGFYYNSINLYGTATGTNATYAFYNGFTVGYTVNDNVLVNTRTGGTGIHYAIYNVPTTGFTSNYNDLFVTGATLGHFGASGTARDKSNLIAWQAIPQDVNSISADPQFTSSANLLPLISSPVIGKGTAIVGITTDIAGVLRHSIAPTIGSYETAGNYNQFALKVFLQGLYNQTNGNMNKCKDYVSTVLVNKFAGTIADTITVELHDANTYSTIVYKAVGIELNQNGTCNSTGLSYINIPAIYSGSYYVTVKSRNHLETTSAIPVSFASGSVVYNFTDAASEAFGSNMILLNTGVYGLYAGDVNQIGSVNLLNVSAINSVALLQSNGYLPADINGDGVVDLLDVSLANSNALLQITKLNP